MPLISCCRWPRLWYSSRVVACIPDRIERSLGRALGRWLLPVLATLPVTFWSGIAIATITQGDFSFYGTLTSTWGGRWGEGSAPGGTASTGNGAAPPDTNITSAGSAPSATGGAYDFNHWDLIEARQGLNVTTDDHIVKNFKLLGRIDTLVLQDADFYANYETWYDAFPDLKPAGRAEPGRDWPDFSSADRTDQFTRNELDEYYTDLNFTDAFSMRVGKQQVVWSEADALSGTEITNPSDYRFGNIDNSTRVNLMMVKFDYILPDFLKTANNAFEAFWIPGDFEGALKAQIVDARNPWIPPVGLGNLTLYNQNGQPFREGTLMDQGATPLYLLPHTAALSRLATIAGTDDFFGDLNVKYSSNVTDRSIDNSEFGGRYSTLIPIGNGLQASAIWLYEARSNKLSTCATCTEPAPFSKISPGIFIALSPQPYGISGFGTSVYDFGPPRIKNNLGTIRLLLRNEWVRQNFFGLTGTYYDKDLSDVVYRYDFFYAPKVIGGGAGFTAPGSSPLGSSITQGQPKWGESTRWILATDRPTYIPWLSKQHTFLVAQYTLTWNPDSPPKTRAFSSLFFLAANNWMLDGRLTTLNVWAWEPDDAVGFVSSTNSYRYSSNILFGVNAIWFLGRTGLNDGLGGVLSRAQRTNELSFQFTYEL